MIVPQPGGSTGGVNRLAAETSPYLLQHSRNPVEWHPWGDEALAAARELDRPIFLSIGYSACHWCHVMEHESFEDSDIAGYMNAHFINIKVDREERPDLDQIYMSAVQALTGHGGWPMSVFLRPDLKPFFGGTYWPPRTRMGMPGFREILEKVVEAWESRRGDVDRGAEELANAVVQLGMPQAGPVQLSENVLENAVRSLLRAADRRNGGFGGAPKFPHPMDLRVLLRGWKRFDSNDAFDVVRLTLDKMAAGGIYDHLGGGFHRYATDAHWLVPHFEKMLYDNALLVPAYLEAFQATGDADSARVARETLEYVLREMTSPEGGFYSTQDADSEGVEGKFFVWSEAEIAEHLGPDDARVVNYCYDVTAQGNWEGHNILNRPKTHAQAANVLGLDEAELSRILDRCRRKLYEVRAQRVHPGRDEKILVSWNGLMIAAMAQGAAVLDDERFAQAACSAADFILDHVRDERGDLRHSYKDGRARFNAYLDDYACLIDGLMELYQTTFEPRYVDAALELAERAREKFRDPQGGGFFYTAIDHEELIARQKDSQDSATPSGNGMAAYALLRLARLTGRPDIEELAVETLEMLSGQMARIPLASGQSLLALDFLRGPAREIVIVEGNQPGSAADALRTLHERFVPNKVVLRRDAETADGSLPASLRPLLRGKTGEADEATIYVCEQGICHAPVTGAVGLGSALDA
ncbi:MAG: thioredoxin domain-containing protein [Planctomycetales bacterium]